MYGQLGRMQYGACKCPVLRQVASTENGAVGMNRKYKMQSKRFLTEYGGQQVSISAIVRLSGQHLVVFLHGLGCTKESFAPVFENIALDGMSILALDFPGHGESDKISDASLYSLQTIADIVNEIIDLFSPKQVSFVGHSMGGAVSLIASQTRRDVFGMVDADGNLVAQDCGIVSRAIASQALDAFLQNGYQEFLQRLQASREQDNRTWAIWSAKADPVAIHELARSLVEWSDSGKLVDLLKSQKRSIYLHGDQDHKDYLLPDLDGVEFRAIADSGHFMMLDNPVNFAKTITNFLSAI
jgi:pimeloyl-ACP methyl ester carboxylesterase